MCDPLNANSATRNPKLVRWLWSQLLGIKMLTPPSFDQSRLEIPQANACLYSSPRIVRHGPSFFCKSTGGLAAMRNTQSSGMWVLLAG